MADHGRRPKGSCARSCSRRDNQPQPGQPASWRRSRSSTSPTAPTRSWSPTSGRPATRPTARQRGEGHRRPGRRARRSRSSLGEDHRRRRRQDADRRARSPRLVAAISRPAGAGPAERRRIRHRRDVTIAGKKLDVMNATRRRRHAAVDGSEGLLGATTVAPRSTIQHRHGAGGLGTLVPCERDRRGRHAARDQGTLGAAAPAPTARPSRHPRRNRARSAATRSRSRARSKRSTARSELLARAELRATGSSRSRGG